MYGYPLTVTDGYSRCLLGGQRLHTPAVREAKPVLARRFKACALPQRRRTDNGALFAPVSLARLATRSAGRVRWGVLPELISRASPSRMVGTSASTATTPPPAANLPAQQRRCNRLSICSPLRQHQRQYPLASRMDQRQRLAAPRIYRTR